VSEVGVFAPKARGKESLIAGEVGFVVANVKVIQDAKVGDTLTILSAHRCAAAGVQGDQADGLLGDLPVDSAEYESTRDALEEAAAERQRLRLRAGDLAGAGVRLPLRLPGCCTWTSCRSVSSGSTA